MTLTLSASEERVVVEELIMLPRAAASLCSVMFHCRVYL